jgi:parvulin-like peptidyl-prolyl isomerase
MNKLYLKFILFTFSIASVFNISTAEIFAEDKIVAIVNNEIITQRDLDDFMNFMYIQLSTKYKDEELKTKVENMKFDLLNKLIEDRLILQEAKKEKISVEEVRIKAKIDELRSRYTCDKEFQNALINQGLTQADLETKIREQLLIYSMVDKKIREKIVINPKDITDFYELNAKDFLEPESRRVISLVIKDEALAKKVLEYIKAGADFNKAGKDYSVELNNLSWVRKGQLKKEIEDAIFSIEIGQVSNIVKVDDLFYIFKIEEVSVARTYTLAEAQDKIYSYLHELNMQKELMKWLDELRKKSYVEIK